MKNIRRFVLDSLQDEMYKVRIMYLQIFHPNPYNYEIEDMLSVHRGPRK